MYIKGPFTIALNDEQGNVITPHYPDAICEIQSADTMGDEVYVKLMIFENDERKTQVFPFTVTVPVRAEDDREIIELRIYEEAINNVCHGFTYSN